MQTNNPHLSPLTSHLSPLASRLSPLTSHPHPHLEPSSRWSSPPLTVLERRLGPEVACGLDLARLGRGGAYMHMRTHATEGCMRVCVNALCMHAIYTCMRHIPRQERSGRGAARGRAARQRRASTRRVRSTNRAARIVVVDAQEATGCVQLGPAGRAGERIGGGWEDGRRGPRGGAWGARGVRGRRAASHWRTHLQMTHALTDRPPT